MGEDEGEGTNILVVDDEPKNLVALDAALATVDCGVLKAGSGREALKVLLSQDFAVIVLDIRMPDMDGFETARLIRARERSRTTPIIFLTADNRTGAQVVEGYGLGAVDYLYKPFVPYVLRAKVAVFVELFRVTADLRLREQQVAALNADLEARVVQRTAALGDALRHVEAESNERLRSEALLRMVEHVAAQRASALAEISRVLVENFMDHRPILSRVAEIAASATDAGCVIQLVEAALDSLVVDHPNQAIHAELDRVLALQHETGSWVWADLDSSFTETHPLVDSLSVQLLARTTNIGTLLLGRFGPDAAAFTESDRRFAEDVAARVALAVENARLYEQARAALALQDQFLAVAAHQLKTPLTAIQGYSQLLSSQLDETLGEEIAPVRRSARMIEERTRHLARLVEQILDISQLAATRLQLDIDDTDLVGMIKNLLVRFERQNDTHEFRFHHSEDHPRAAVDPTRMQQVMANLIDNAVRYSPESGPIDVTLEQDDDAVLISVRDQGLGIPDGSRARIFERFYQAHTSDYRSGMGLGLHISREIVLLHGGTLTAMFPGDGGSEFTVCLPRSSCPPSDAEALYADASSA